MKKQLTKSRIIGYLLMLTAASLGVLSASYARYSDQMTSEGNVAIAVWGSDAVIEPLPIDVSGLKPGDAKTFTFQVTNTKDGKTSQVAQAYSFTVVTTENLPLQFALSSAVSNPSGGGTMISLPGGNGSAGVLSFTDGKAELTGGFLPHTDQVTHQYTLTVTWPDGEDSNGSDYADEIDLVTLTVKADQVIPAS